MATALSVSITTIGQNDTSDTLIHDINIKDIRALGKNSKAIGITTTGVGPADLYVFDNNIKNIKATRLLTGISATGVDYTNFTAFIDVSNNNITNLESSDIKAINVMSLGNAAINKNIIYNLKCDKATLITGVTLSFDLNGFNITVQVLKDSRITSGMTAYFADGVYDYEGMGKISSKTVFIGQSRENTIIRGADYYFDLTISSGSSLVLKDITFDYGHIINQGDLNADNVAFVNSKCDYDPDSSAFTAYGSGGAIFSNPSTRYVCNINLNNCYFDTNHAKHGGAIAANYTNIVITNCVFSNSLSNRSGGAIYSLKSNITVSKSSFTKSNAKYGEQPCIWEDISTLRMPITIIRLLIVQIMQ